MIGGLAGLEDEAGPGTGDWGLWTALFDPERCERLAEHIMAPSRFHNEAMYVASGQSLLDLIRGAAGFARRWDPLEHLCRTRLRGAQDWRLRLDRLAAETLGQPFQSSSNAERTLHRRLAPAQVTPAPVHRFRSGTVEVTTVDEK